LPKSMRNVRFLHWR